MLQPGDPAPDFTLPDQAGTPVRLQQLLAAGPLLLYFYPADFTPVCSRQACLFRDRTGALRAAGIGVAGISPQGTASHGRFAARFALAFPLLADPERRVIRAYGAGGLLGLWVARVSYLIGRGGIVEDAERAGFRLRRHAGLVDRALARYAPSGKEVPRRP